MGLNWIDRRAGSRRARGSLAWLILAALLFVIPPARAAAISRVDLTSSGAIILRFDGSVEKASAFLLDKPARLAIDVGGARAGSASISGGLIARTRHGQYDPSTARVVFDLAEPAVISDGRLAEDRRSLTLSLTPATRISFMDAVKEGRRSFGSLLGLDASPAKVRNNVTIPLEPPRPALPTPPVTGARGTNRPLVVIDAPVAGMIPARFPRTAGPGKRMSRSPSRGPFATNWPHRAGCASRSPATTIAFSCSASGARSRAG